MRVLVACEESQAVCIAFREKGHEAYSCDILPPSGGHPEWHIQDDVLNVLKASDIIKKFVSDKPCVKQTTVAVLINGDNYWVGSNYCDTPMRECPRKDMPTGVGYELCKSICGQQNHAEVDACRKAGSEARGGTLYLGGHYYACENCKRVADEHGVKQIVILPKDGWDMMIGHPPCTWLCQAMRTNAARKDRPNITPIFFDERNKALDFFMQLYNANIPKIAVENPIGYINSAFRKPDQIIRPWMFGHPYRKDVCLWLKNLPLLKPTDIVKGRKKLDFWSNKRNPGGVSLKSKTFPGIAKAMAEQWSKIYATI